MHLITISLGVIKEAKEHDSSRISAQGSNPSFSPFCFLFTFLLLISARTLRRISTGFLQLEILWLLHVRIVQYFTKEFQREPMFLRFIDEDVCVGRGRE